MASCAEAKVVGWGVDMVGDLLILQGRLQHWTPALRSTSPSLDTTLLVRSSTVGSACFVRGVEERWSKGVQHPDRHCQQQDLRMRCAGYRAQYAHFYLDVENISVKLVPAFRRGICPFTVLRFPAGRAGGL